MLSKINRDILFIIYRWKWQLSMNKINHEYNMHCDVNETTHHITIVFWGSHDLSNDYDFNYRLSDKVLWGEEIYSKNYVEPTGILGENYEYTSTKYLREIKESGIKCLSIEDNA